MAQIITVVSGKGGVGKTNISVNLGIALSQKKKGVVIVDADLGLANVNILLGVNPKYNLSHLITGSKTIDEILIPIAQDVKIIAGASGFKDLTNLKYHDKLKFLTAIKSLNYMDYIIIDSGAGISDNVLNFAVASDKIIIVTTPEPTSITDAYAMIKSIKATAITHPPLFLVINRAKTDDEGLKMLDIVSSISLQFLSEPISKLGYILEDSRVSQSVLNQVPFVLGFPKAKATEGLLKIADSINGIPTESRGIEYFFHKFLSGKSL